MIVNCPECKGEGLVLTASFDEDRNYLGYSIVCHGCDYESEAYDDMEIITAFYIVKEQVQKAKDIISNPTPLTVH